MRKRLSVSTSRSAGLLAVAVAWALFLALTGSPEAILFTIPLFLLAAPLAIGRYVGEDVLARLRTRPRPGSVAVPGLGLATGTKLLVGLAETGFRPVRGPPAASI